MSIFSRMTVKSQRAELARQIEAEQPELAGLSPDRVIEQYVSDQLETNYHREMAYLEIINNPMRPGAKRPEPMVISPLLERALLLMAPHNAAQYVQLNDHLARTNFELRQRVANLEAQDIGRREMAEVAMDLSDRACEIIKGDANNKNVNSAIKVN